MPLKYSIRKKKYTKKPKIVSVLGQRIPQSIPKYPQQYPLITSQPIHTLPDKLLEPDTSNIIPSVEPLPDTSNIIPSVEPLPDTSNIIPSVEPLPDTSDSNNLSDILNNNTPNNPYKCKKDIVTHIQDKMITAVTQTITCKCHGADCIHSTNSNKLFHLFSGGSKKKIHNRSQKILKIHIKNRKNNTRQHKKKKNNQDINSLFIRLQIDPSKITNKHCSRYGTTDTLYHFTSNFNTNTQVDNLQSIPKIEPKNSNPYLKQRQVILGDIQVLLRFYDTNRVKHPTVLYICESSGTHLITLSKMFPMVKFILYGLEINTQLHTHPMFEIHDSTTAISDEDITDRDNLHDGVFTTLKCSRLAEKLKKTELIFISDIRFEMTKKDLFEFERSVFTYMRLQETWMQILQPILSLVTFRMPIWPKNTNMPYLKGDILYGIWSNPISKETRLLVPRKNILDNSIEMYKSTNYYENLTYHNVYTREICQAWIPEPFNKYIVSKDNIYCSCYDCIAELNILYEYSFRFNHPFDEIIRIFGKEMNANHKVIFPKSD